MVKSYFSKKYFVSVTPFFLFFAIRILFTSLVSVFLLDQGYSALNVSTISAVALVASFCAVPWIGKCTDTYSPKNVSGILLFIASLSGIVFAFSKSIFGIGFLYSIVMICINTLHPIIEKQATQMDFSYGSVRIWGTMGNAIGTQIGGFLYQYISPQSVYIVFGLATIATWFVMNKSIGKGVNKAKVINPKEKGPRKEHLSIFVLYLVVTFCFYAALDTKTLYLTAFLRTSGFTVNEATTILFVASLFEIPVVLFGGRIVDKFHSKALIICSLILLGLQLLVYAFLNYPIMVVVITLLTNSVVSMFYIMINMKAINEIVNADHQLSALTVTTGIRSLAAVVGQTFGGKLIDNYSYQYFFILLFAFIVLALLISLITRFPRHKNDLHLYN